MTNDKLFTQLAEQIIQWQKGQNGLCMCLGNCKECGFHQCFGCLCKEKALFLQALTDQRREIVEMIKGKVKTHREFECNGAHGGKGCYETWCDMETCTSKDAMECKSFNQALHDTLSDPLLAEEK